MKRILSVLIVSIALISAIIVTASANDFINENEFTVASFNEVYSLRTDKGLKEIEDACWWLVTTQPEYNLKFVSLIGRIGNPNTVTRGSLAKEEYIRLCLAEEEWGLQYKKLANSISPLADEGIPCGVSASKFDYAGSGASRQTVMPEYLSADAIMTDKAEFEFCDEMNYCTVVENNGTKYLIFQLELWPTEPVLAWFNETLTANPDKYAIVFTSSFIDDSGEMYTMWDWDNGFKAEGTTAMKSYAICWDSHAHDGIGIWNKAIAKHDNVLAVISSNVTTPDIVTSKFKNDRGIEVASIAANADISMNKSNGPTVLMTKFSPDNTEITCAWAVPYQGVVESSVKTVKLSKIGTLSEPEIKEAIPQVAVQYNGANTAYIYGYEGNTFRPNANMTRAEACTIFARLILGVQSVPDGYNTRFTDVKTGDWFHNAIAYLDTNGFFDRKTDNQYKPNEPITRAEFVELANLASTLKGTASVSFKDVPEDHFYYESIIAAASAGLVNGYEDSTFRPDNTITRAEVVTVINRLLGLKVSERTVSLYHLENEFVDIGGHWARLNVLMASNSNVHGDYYYDATLDGVKESATTYTFANKHISISVTKKTGKVKEIINLADGSNIMRSATTFIYVLDNEGETVAPKNMETEGNRIKVTFKNDTVAYLIVDVEDDYMTFEIDSEIAPSLSRITFAVLSTTLKAATSDTDYMLNSIGMTAWTNPVVKGYRETADTTTAHAYTQYAYGTMGAKLGFVFSTKAEALPLLQKLTDTIDPRYGIKSKAGGAYAKEWESNFGDYAIIDDTNPETLDEYIEMMKEIDADQVDLHERSATTFRSGDFWFAYTETGTAKEYYEKIGKKFEEAGLETALHTYAYYITYDSEQILKEPKWQKQLETLETYTLRTDMSATRTTIPTEEDADNFDLKSAFFYKNSRYVLIDNEIIYIGDAIGSGFIKVLRGQCGTAPATHKKGTTIYHLSGYFGRFVPVLGSDLYYHVADLTAKAYNDGGFSMIYLDAIDGLAYHLPEGHETWYYHQTFLQRIVSQCKKPPVIETSAGSPQEWLARGRTGAWDTGANSIKKYINIHIEANKGSMKNNMVTTLGWFDFQPDMSTISGLKNTIEKSLFHDDLDALGMGALLYDMTIVYHSFDIDAVKNNPFNRENIAYYTGIYAKLRKSHYFNESTIEKVKKIGGEWKVVEKSKGEYAFLQMYYHMYNAGNAKNDPLNTFKATNPFEKQTPFIRIESRYSTLFNNPMTVFEFDENATVGTGVITKNFAKTDFSKNMAFVARVKGTGADGDAMLISVQSKNSAGGWDGRTDYFIDLNFEGWREVVLIDSDCADYDTSKYSFPGIVDKQINYDTFRNIVYYNRITQLAIRTCGETAKNAQIGTVYAYEHTDAPVKNPTVTVGAESITFNCTMGSSDYLEYDPLTNKAILYRNVTQTTEEVGVSGSLSIAKGDFTATYTAEAQTDAPVRARVVLGFAGQEITN